MTALAVRVAGRGAQGTTGGRVMAAGAGWAWLRTEQGPVHLTGERGPRSPLTAVIDRVSVLEPGARVDLDASFAEIWITPPPPPAAEHDRVVDACQAVEAYLWNDPRARALATRPLGGLVAELVGRGPGLTPAGDDALLGFLVARRAIGAPDFRRDAAVVLSAARSATGNPSLAFLRWAARGEVPEPVAFALAALLTGDGPRLAPAVRRLTAFGRTTGRAVLTGLVGGLVFDG